MITIVCLWDSVQLDNQMEWRMWRQLQGAFFPVPADVNFVFAPINPALGTVNFQQFDTVAEALSYAASVNPSASRVFLEPSGTKSLSEIPTGDIIIVLGNTGISNAGRALSTELYKIESPGSTDLYGINAAAIALAVRYGQ